MSGKQTSEDRIKKQYINHFQKLMIGKTQKENEDMLVGETYMHNGHLAQSEEQVINAQKRVGITKKFSIVGNKLAFDGVVCEELTP